jgi:aryl-alcohol dehydrogenase-like predicted oxidoreductase
MGGAQWDFTSDETNIKAVRTALDHGVTSFDTAEGYGDGHSEEALGRALAGRRTECVIATKVSKEHLRAADLKKSLTQSLRRLGTEYADIYYIHRPNPDIPVAESMEELMKAKKQGIIRAIGVSNFSLEQLQGALKYGEVDVVQNEYSLLQRDAENDVLPFCAQNGISMVSYSSLAKGILTGSFHKNGVGRLKDGDFRHFWKMFSEENLAKESELIEHLKDIASKIGASPSQIAIAWILKKPGIASALVGTQSEKHLIDNIHAVDIALSKEDEALLDNFSERAIRSIK